jgi:hypothetical protein
MGEKIVRFERVCVWYWGGTSISKKLTDLKLDSEDLGNRCMGNEAVT